MKKFTDLPINLIVRMLIMVGICAIVGQVIWAKATPNTLPFKDLSGRVYVGLIGWLFAVALFVERAVEVVVMVFRDYQADQLQAAGDRSQKDYDNACKIALANPTDQVFKVAADKTEADLTVANNAEIIYRSQTKEIALLVGFAFGIMVSIAGVRALHGLLRDNAQTTGWFDFADIIVTGAMLAGGSEGIHRMANAFTSFMDNLSNRADQDQKDRQNKSGTSTP